MISDDMSFSAKGKVFKMLNSKHCLKVLFQCLSIMSQHLEVICLNKQQVIDALKILPSLFQRSLNQWYFCQWVGEEYNLNFSWKHHIHLVGHVKHHRTVKDNHLRFHSWSFQMLQHDSLTKWNQYLFSPMVVMEFSDWIVLEQNEISN